MAIVWVSVKCTAKILWDEMERVKNCGRKKRKRSGTMGKYRQQMEVKWITGESQERTKPGKIQRPVNKKVQYNPLEEG